MKSGIDVERSFMNDIPQDRYICKWCVHCEIFDENYEKEMAMCNVDIGDLTKINNPACCDFEYGDTFHRW